MDATTLQVLAVIFVATTFRSAFGFGEALIAVPLLALVLPVEVVVPLAVLISILVAAVVVVQDWQHVQVRSAGWLLLSTLFGIPLGVLGLKLVPEPIVKGILAALLIVFSSWSLLRRHKLQLNDDRLAWLFGFSAGVLGGAYGVNGPPLVIYGTLRRWSPEHFRATLQGYFLPASLAGMFGYWWSGLWTAEVTHYSLLCLPVAVVAILLGRIANRRFKGESFYTWVHCGLIVIGFLLLQQALC